MVFVFINAFEPRLPGRVMEENGIYKTYIALPTAYFRFFQSLYA